MHTRAHISLIPAAVIACIACSSFGRSISCLSTESTRFSEVTSPPFSPPLLTILCVNFRTAHPSQKQTVQKSV